MSRIVLSTFIAAPLERCFDLSRSVELHLHSTAASQERAVGGQVTGLLDIGAEVTWRATHLGFWQELTSRMTFVDRPVHFRDSMVRGAFKRFDHDHYFTAEGSGTRMRDVFDFEAPLGPLGSIAEWLFLKRYMRRLLVERNSAIRTIAESDAWRAFIPGSL